MCWALGTEDTTEHNRVPTLLEFTLHENKDKNKFPALDSQLLHFYYNSWLYCKVRVMGKQIFLYSGLDIVASEFPWGCLLSTSALLHWQVHCHTGLVALGSWANTWAYQLGKRAPKHGGLRSLILQLNSIFSIQSKHGLLSHVIKKRGNIIGVGSGRAFQAIPVWTMLVLLHLLLYWS